MNQRTLVQCLLTTLRLSFYYVISPVACERYSTSCHAVSAHIDDSNVYTRYSVTLRISVSPSPSTITSLTSLLNLHTVSSVMADSVNKREWIVLLVLSMSLKYR